jgi:hypothetical protein
MSERGRRLSRRDTSSVLSNESRVSRAHESDRIVVEQHRATVECLQNQALKFWSWWTPECVAMATTDNHLCRFVRGSVYYTVDFDDNFRTMKIVGVVYHVKEGDNEDHLKTAITNYNEQLKTNSERDMVWDRTSCVIFVSQSVPVAFLLGEESFEELKEIVEDLVNFAGEARTVLKHLRQADRRKHHRFNPFRRKQQRHHLLPESASTRC